MNAHREEIGSLMWRMGSLLLWSAALRYYLPIVLNCCSLYIRSISDGFVLLTGHLNFVNCCEVIYTYYHIIIAVYILHINIYIYIYHLYIHVIYIYQLYIHVIYIYIYIYISYYTLHIYIIIVYIYHINILIIIHN